VIRLSAALRQSWDSDLAYSFRTSPYAIVAALVFLLCVGSSVFAPWVAPHNPFDLGQLDLSNSLKPPAWLPGGDPVFPLGTDDQGRDILSTILFGARISLLVGICAVLFSMVLGVSLGLLAGYVGGKTDAFIMRVADVQLSFPAILIALLVDGVARALLPGEHDSMAFYVLVLSIGVSGWVQYARTVRGSTLVEKSKEGDVDPNFLRAGVVKVFADGVMEYPAQTAALLCPYLDAHGKPTKSRGKLDLDPKFAQLVTKLDAAGLTVHVHAIGDRAVRTTLDAFAAAREKNGDRDNRHQIAHLQLVDPADVPRFKALGVIADFQLLWARREPESEGPLEPYLGPKRYRNLYPAGSLHAAGALIIGGSDWDVSSYNPFEAFQTAVTRSGGKGQKPLNIDEKIPLTTAVDAYTINAAFAMKQEATTGSLEVGKRADLVVLDRDIFSVDPYKIGNTKVLRTYLDGQPVYSSPNERQGATPSTMKIPCAEPE